MAVVQPDVQIRAWDLGGFGDIAGAMRTASHVQKGGLSTTIVPTSAGAMNKLNILSPDVSVSVGLTDCLQVDVAGHYFDGRTRRDPTLVPHLFAEDMDNPSDRRDIVPVYIKTGLRPIVNQVPLHLGGYIQSPMFYRPFREWDLPEPGKRDVKSLIVQAMGFSPARRYVHRIDRIKKCLQFGISPKAIDMNQWSDLIDILDVTDYISFGHFQPDINPDAFFAHPYICALEIGASESGTSQALGLFFNGSLEDQIARVAVDREYSVVRRDGIATPGSMYRPTLIFMGPQSQLMTTSLFLSATMPNLVTGDLSLSDALYGLVAMDGPAFFYDCPGWKAPTYNELVRILSNYNGGIANHFAVGSVNIRDERYKDEEWVWRTRLLASPSDYGNFATGMRGAIRAEIAKRFGMPLDDVVCHGKDADGLYVPRGAPFLFQDAVETVLHILVENPDALKEVEGTRKRLSEGQPVAIVVNSDVMAPAKPMDVGVVDDPDELDLMKLYGKPYGKNYYENSNDYEYKPLKLFNIHFNDKGNNDDFKIKFNNIYQKPMGIIFNFENKLNYKSSYKY